MKEPEGLAGIGAEVGVRPEKPEAREPGNQSIFLTYTNINRPERDARLSKLNYGIVSVNDRGGTSQ